MESVLWYLVPLAIAVALSIFPVLAVVLLLLSNDPAKSSISYAAGWSSGVIVLVTAFAVGARLIPKESSDHLPSWAHYVEIVIGAALIIEGIASVLRDRRRAEKPRAPKWLAKASNLGPRPAFAFGLAMNVRPKNLTLTLAAGIAIGAAPITLVAASVSVLVFAIIGVSTVTGLVVAYLLGPKRVRPLLAQLNSWLVSHASLVLQLSVVLIGVILVIVGISALVNGS